MNYQVFHPGHHGLAYGQEVVEAALDLAQFVPQLTNQEIATLIGVPDESTIRSWRSRDMSPEAMEERRLSKGLPHRLLRPTQELILAGCILLHDLLRLDTSTAAIRSMALRLFGLKKLQSSWISAFCSRNHISLRSFVVAHAAELRAPMVDSITLCLASIQSLHLPPDRIVNMDLTSVYSMARYVLQAAPVGSCVRSSPHEFSLFQ